MMCVLTALSPVCQTRLLMFFSEGELNLSGGWAQLGSFLFIAIKVTVQFERCFQLMEHGVIS